MLAKIVESPLGVALGIIVTFVFMEGVRFGYLVGLDYFCARLN